MAEKCSVKYQLSVLRGVNLHLEDRQCQRAAEKDGFCFFHLDNPNKPLKLILDEIERQSESDNYKDIDLTHFVFPKGDFQYPVAMRKPLFMEHCKFYGNVSFADMHLPDYASFRGAHFFGTADFGYKANLYHNRPEMHQVIFNNVTFHGHAYFRATKFKYVPEFAGTIFLGLAVFAWSEIDFESKSHWFEFRNCEFHGDADLEIRGVGNIQGLRFAYCNLAGLKIATLPKEGARIEFENNKQWDEDSKWYQWPRKRIRDERAYASDPVKVIDMYRYLEQYFYRHSDFNLARHFYIGQMIVTRHDENYERYSKVLNVLYQAVSNYGDSVLRPAALLLCSFILFPIILLFAGINVDRLDNGSPTWVNYQIKQVFTGNDTGHFWADYKSAFGANLSLSTFDRKHEFSPPSDSLQKGILIIETLINISLASLILVASRRKFTPKKPQGM